jgi:Family of unknown function (DUF6228)
VSAAEIRSSSGRRRLVFSDAHWSGDELNAYTAKLEVEAMSAMTQVYAYGPSPLVLFEEMAGEWRGWKATKKWQSLEGELALAATHDGLGTIALHVELAHLGADGWDWRADAVLTLDSGSQLETAVGSARAFFSS